MNCGHVLFALVWVEWGPCLVNRIMSVCVLCVYMDLGYGFSRSVMNGTRCCCSFPIFEYHNAPGFLGGHFEGHQSPFLLFTAAMLCTNTMVCSKMNYVTATLICSACSTSSAMMPGRVSSGLRVRAHVVIFAFCCSPCFWGIVEYALLVLRPCCLMPLLVHC